MTTSLALEDFSRVSRGLMASIALATLALAGCGGGGDGSQTDTALDAPASAEAAAADDTSAASTTSTARSAGGRAQALAVNWVWCANEGTRCNFSGARQVRYGTATSNVVRTFTNGAVCSNAVFGDPARNTRKQCWYNNGTTSSTPTPAPAPPTTGGSFSTTQIYALRDQYVSGMQGQYTNIRLRFFGVPMGVNSKAFVHLYRSDGVLQAATGHHMRYLPSAGWRGHLQFDHPVYIASSVPPGTYRISVGLYQSAAPWSLLMNRLQGNGVSLLSTHRNNVGYHVGYMSVTPANRAATADVRWGSSVQLAATGWY